MTTTNTAFAPLRPEVAAFLEELSNTPTPPIEEMTPEQVRATMRNNIAKFTVTTPTLDTIDDRHISTKTGTVLARFYTPISESRPLPVVVYFHGGGWVAGDLNTVDNICRFICHHSHCLVISIDYPLAPEHKFSHIVQQCYESLQWIHQQVKTYGGDSHRIAVAGDSSGANLAAAMTLMAKDQNQSWSIIYQALICPVTNLAAFDTHSYQHLGIYGLTREKMLWFCQQYLSKHSDAFNPYASPLLAKNLTALPPALVVTGEFDVLRDEGQRYAEHLQKAHVPTTVHCMKRMPHSGVFWVAAAPVIADDVAFVCQQIRLHLRS